MKKLFITACTALFTLHAAYAGGDMAADIRSGTFWTLSQDAVTNKYFVGEMYSWLDDAKTQIRIHNRGNLKVGGFSPEVYMFNTSGDKFDSIAVMVYNKGDNGPLSKQAFDNKVEQTINALNEALGVKATGGKKAGKKDSPIAERTWRWTWEGGAAAMEAASTGGDAKSGKGKKGAGSSAPFESEYIRVRIGVNAEAIATGGAKDTARRADIKKNCIRRAAAIPEAERPRCVSAKAVWLDVPMVDQGDKGYCLPATVSRIFSLYGMDGVDMHTIAAMCDSSASQGTTTESMVKALRSIASKYHVKLFRITDEGKVIPIASKETKKERESKFFASPEAAVLGTYPWVAEYNKLASREGKPGIPMRTDVNPLEVADPDLLLKARSKGVKKFMDIVKKNVDAGVPLFWCVTLGLYPEEPALPQSRGGHMRLIIGYDEGKKTIIYSDSWGAGHEVKAMDVSKAAAMTADRFALKSSR
ncbi:MAG: C39 family peptidase [Akkermansia muciniphila]